LKITVVICTYRRPDSLVRTLASLADAEPPVKAEWQVLVVDNAACAETESRVRGFANRLPVEYLAEPKAGLSHARNAAVMHLTRANPLPDYVIWTDDDVAVAPRWLRSYEAAFAKHPEAAFFGGPVVPEFEGRPPAWLKAALPRVDTAFAAVDLADRIKEGRLSLKYLPFGANMAIRMQELRALQFDAGRGRQPGQWLLSGEESELLREICRSGGVGMWVPEAPVAHWIDQERQSIAYLRRYYEGLGITEARAALAQSPMQDTGTVQLRWDLFTTELTFLMGWLLRKPRVWVGALKKASRLRAALAARREVVHNVSRKSGNEPGREPRPEAGLGLETEA
jgi:glycosyltransferase involved in cell wall biosynthesis